MSCERCGALQPSSSSATSLASGRSESASASLPLSTQGSGLIRPVSTSIPSVAPRHRSAQVAQTRFLDARVLEQELRDLPDAPSTSLKGRVKLVVEQGLIIGEQYLLNDDELHIGRHVPGSGYCPDIELSAQDPSFVHRQHASLHFQQRGERLIIRDHGGRNGVFVNNHAVASCGEQSLKVGDKVRIGRVVLKLLSVNDNDRAI